MMGRVLGEECRRIGSQPLLRMRAGDPGQCTRSDESVGQPHVTDEMPNRGNPEVGSRTTNIDLEEGFRGDRKTMPAGRYVQTESHGYRGSA